VSVSFSKKVFFIYRSRLKMPIPQEKATTNKTLPDYRQCRKQYDQFLVIWSICPCTKQPAGFLAEGSPHEAAFPTQSQ
jgi:hypothetical protein